MTFGRRLPEGPVKLKSRHRLTFLQAMLLISFLMHAVGLFGWSLSPPVKDDDGEKLIHTVPVTWEDYTEQAPAARVVAAPAATAPPPSRGSGVAYASGYVATLNRRPPEESTPRHEDEPRIDATPTPLPTPQEDTTHAQATPTPAAAGPSPTPQPNATPMPPLAAAPLATPSPLATPGPVQPQDPNADFALRVMYHNDDRIPRDANGKLVIDANKLQGLPDVKPVLAQVPKQVLPLKDAGKFGLHPLDDVKAVVKVSVEVRKDTLTPLVKPAHVEVENVTVDGRTVEGAVRDEIVLFVQDGVSETMWLPASSRGQLVEHSEQTFEVEVIQVTNDTAMSPPSSRAP